MSWLLAKVAGPLSAHALDGAAFIVPSLEGLLARIVLTLGVLVCHSRNMRPISRDRHPGLSRSRSRHQHVRGERVQFQAVPSATAGGSCQASPPGPLAPSPLPAPARPAPRLSPHYPKLRTLVGAAGRSVQCRFCCKSRRSEARAAEAISWRCSLPPAPLGSGGFDAVALTPATITRHTRRLLVVVGRLVWLAVAGSVQLQRA
jgi:hypothetical protein